MPMVPWTLRMGVGVGFKIQGSDLGWLEACSCIASPFEASGGTGGDQIFRSSVSTYCCTAT